MTGELTVLISQRIGLYTADPLLRSLTAKGVHVIIACPASVAEHARPYGSEIVELESMPRWRLLRRLHRVTLLLITSLNYSFHYRAIVRKDLGPTGYRVLKVLKRLLPSVTNANINRCLHRLLSRFLDNPFPTETILVVSRASHPHLLCARNQKIFTLMESWDHPTKYPAGYVSAGVFAWNKDIAEDWRSFQGDHTVEIGYPFKLRYALHEDQRTGRVDAGTANALYAASSSSFSGMRRFGEEMEVINEVCEATRLAGWDLVIKPRPNGRKGDFDHFLDRFAHVSVAEYGDSTRAGDYYLDDEYNARRFNQLRATDLVICLTTTFALDAAAFGLPVVQLDLRGYEGLQHTARRSTNHHLVRYLLREPELTLAPKAAGCLTDELADWLTSLDSRPVEYSRMLRDWLNPRTSMEQALERIMDMLLSDANSTRQGEQPHVGTDREGRTSHGLSGAQPSLHLDSRSA